MSDLPQGWAESTLGDLVTLRGDKVDPAGIPEKSFLGLEDIEPHTSTILRVGTASEVKSSVACFEAGDVLYSRLRPYLNKVTRPDFSGVASAEILALKPSDAAEAEFVRRKIMTREFLDFTAMLDKGDRPRVSYDEIAAFQVFLPPLPEQRRMVEKIDSLTGKSRRARDHLVHIPRLVEKYKQAILAAAFRGDLTRDWREARGLPTPRSVLLGDVAEGFNYGSAAKSAKEGRVPVLRMGNIQDGKLDWADLVFTDDAAEIAKYALKEGDVLFNRTNSPALVGKTALFNGEREAIYAGYLIKVRCKAELLPAFLTYCINAPNGRAYSWAVKTDGVSQSNINAKKLAAFRFDLPSTEEQAEIVRRIEAALSWINRITVDASSARKLIGHLDQSVLAKAFKGELVPQNPIDEPASALLERIRTERAAAQKAKHGRKKAA